MNSQGGGLTAAGLLVLLLAFIGLGVGIYYAYICLRARPLRSKPPTDSERGPLINPDPDVNGNHEDAPLEASAPADDDDNTKYKTPLDEPDIGNGQVKSLTSDPPENVVTSSKTPKQNDEILVPIENAAPPAKIVHERELVSPLNQVAPLMLASPAVLQEISPDCHPQQNSKPIPQPQLEAEVQPTRNTPTPVYIPVPHAKKPLTLSDEEDGLLLSECVPHDDSIDSEHCPKPISFIPQADVPSSTKHEKLEASNVPHKEDQFQCDPVLIPLHTASAPPMPETPTSDPTQPLPSSQSAEPEITVVEPAPQPAPQPAPGYGWKEDVTPVGKAVEPVSPELLNNKLSPLLVQEDIEQIQPIQDTHCLVPINEIKLDILDKKSIEKNKSQPESPEISPRSTLNNKHTPKIPEEAPGKLVECPPLVCLETSPPPEQLGSCLPSTSSEEAVPSCTEIGEKKIPESIIPEEASSEVPTESSLDNVKRQLLLDDNCEPVMVIPLESSVTNPTDASNTPNKPPSLKDFPKAQTDSDSQAFNIPEETLADIPPNASTSISAKALEDIPLVISNIPLEAYIPNIDEEYDIDSAEGDSILPVIKEEGSVGTESECVETDSSEPEVTEYSFASGPSAPSTSVVLADEVSSTLEPEVTKYVIISDAEASCDSDLSESENSDDEDDYDPNKVNSDILPARPTSFEQDSKCNNEKTIQANPDSSRDKPDPSSHSLPFVKDAAPTIIKPDDSASNVLAIIATSNDGHSQSPDSTNILSKYDSNSEGSDTESEGAEAEAELREEVVKVPTAVHGTSPEFISTSVPPETSVVDTIKTPVVVSDPYPQKSLDTKVPNNPLQEISDSAEEISSSSCTSDLSDDDITTSTPKKSKIPRLVNCHES
ncbi:uncharacterized protein [Procambarus clarkii]|uniref:uncharacterized protein isoform X3 n=1 Tax=Procambarus clarkii TaxID=6728 RepID=UPI003742EC5C